MPFANPRPFDELSASNQRSIGKARRKIKVPKTPRIAKTGRRAETKGTGFRKIWTNKDPRAPMKASTGKKRAFK